MPTVSEVTERPLSGLDPQLPVRVRIAEREVLTLDALDDPAPDVLGFENTRRELVIGLRQQEIRARDLDHELGPELVDDLVEGSRGGNLSEPFVVLVGQGEILAVGHKLDVGIASGPADAEFVRPAQRRLA